MHRFPSYGIRKCILKFTHIFGVVPRVAERYLQQLFCANWRTRKRLSPLTIYGRNFKRMKSIRKATFPHPGG